jgi:hypothetical protein
MASRRNNTSPASGMRVVRSRRINQDHQVPEYGADVAELVDAARSQRVGRKPEGVRISPSAPWH